MKNKLYLALALFLSTWGPGCVEFAQAGNGSGNVTNTFSFGGSLSTPGNAAPSIFDNDVTKWYAVQCGFGSSNVTSGNYYKCQKLGGAAGDWSISSTKVAYCTGHYAFTNSTASTAYSFGYGTAATAGNTSSAPTGSQSYASSGTNFMWAQAASGESPKWWPVPVKFDATVPAATIFPYVRVDSATGQVLNLTLICKEI